MTVHGAKGLEAPVVILADATADPAGSAGRRSPSISRSRRRRAPLLRPKKEERGAAVRRDHRGTRSSATWRSICGCSTSRMTRAADRLIVSGVMPKTRKDGADPRPANSWHLIVEQALGPIAEAGDGPCRASLRRRAWRERRRAEGAASNCREVRSPRVGKHVRRRPKRDRRVRSRRPRLRSTTKRAAAERSDARRRASRHAGSISFWSACRRSKPSARPTPPTAGSNAPRGWVTRRSARKSSPRFAASCPTRASRLFGPGIARRSAARRDLGRRARDRRHRRSPPSR